ncbi:hypothetical protein VP01_7g16 [Puccinia sorghi]|uniref:Uncharacterized protein n=1 Tax=Puccinia sorghi TaxID=27349 RepID=A0A0L6UAN2_9BASI|nr:hypothetical protein VP01_7g16 [Puccinia sorghi]
MLKAQPKKEGLPSNVADLALECNGLLPCGWGIVLLERIFQESDHTPQALRPEWTLDWQPLLWRMIEEIWPMGHAQHKVEVFEALKEQKQLTLYLDGCTKKSVNSISALMLLKGANKKNFLDVLDLNHKQHTGNNTFLARKYSILSKKLS